MTLQDKRTLTGNQRELLRIAIKAVMASGKATISEAALVLQTTPNTILKWKDAETTEEKPRGRRLHVSIPVAFAR